MKTPKRLRPIRYGAVFWMIDPAGQVLLRRRPARGLLGGMLELPGTAWTADPPGRPFAAAPQLAEWRYCGQAVHGFTHFELRLDVYGTQVERIDAEGLLYLSDRLADTALPTVMRRCITLAKK